MGDLGAKLRQAREEKGVTLEEIFAETKIQVRHLKALEEEDFRLFPGEVYVRGALRNYAAVVGLDYQEVLSLYRQASRGEEKAEPEAAPPQEREEKKIEILRPRRKPRRRKPFLTFLIVLLVLVALVYAAGLLLEGWEREEGPDETPVTEDPAPGPEEPDEEPVEEEPPPQVTLTRPDPGQEVYLVSGAEALELAISFRGDCWMRVWEDGDQVSSGTYRRGQDYSLETAKNLEVRLGNPRGVASFTVNGLAVETRDTNRPYNIEIRLEAP